MQIAAQVFWRLPTWTIGCPQTRDFEKSYHLKPRMIPEKNVGYHHLTSYLLQLNPTLLDTITSDLTKVPGLRNPMTTTHGDPQG